MLRRRLAQCVFLLLVAAHAAAGSGTWTPIGPPAAYLQAIAFDPATPNTMYAGTRGGGVFKKTDGGSPWISINRRILGPTDSTTPDGRWIYSIAVDPTNTQIVYAGGGGCFYRSLNGGQSWTLLSSTVGAQSIAIDPNNSATLYVGNGGGLYKSTNSGSSWTDITAAIPSTGGSSLYALAGYLYRTTEAGGTFTRIEGTSSFDPPVHVFDVDPTNGSRLF